MPDCREGEKKQEAMERIREGQTAKKKGIASIYKPEREHLDGVMENKTQREKEQGEGVEREDRQMGEKDEKMDGYKEGLPVNRKREEEKGGWGGIHLP